MGIVLNRLQLSVAPLGATWADPPRPNQGPMAAPKVSGSNQGPSERGNGATEGKGKDYLTSSEVHLPMSASGATNTNKRRRHDGGTRASGATATVLRQSTDAMKHRLEAPAVPQFQKTQLVVLPHFQGPGIRPRCPAEGRNNRWRGGQNELVGSCACLTPRAQENLLSTF